MTAIILSIIAAVAVLALVVFVCFVYKYLTNSSKRMYFLEIQNSILETIAHANSEMKMAQPLNEPKENKPEVVVDEKKPEVKEEKKDGQSKMHPNDILEKTKIFNALKQHNGCIKEAAKRIMMPYPTFHKKCIRYGLEKYMKNSNKVKKLERMNKYNALRKAGKSIVDAAKELGVGMQTAEKYELAYLTNK